MSSYNVATVVWRENRQFQEPEYLVVDVKYTTPAFANMPTQTKFIGGGNEPRDKGLVVATGARELWEEANLKFLRHEPEIIYHGANTEDGVYHDRFWLLLHESEVTGEIRTWIMNDIRSILYPPRWVRESVLIPQIHPTHRAALEAAQRILLPAMTPKP